MKGSEEMKKGFICLFIVIYTIACGCSSSDSIKMSVITLQEAYDIYHSPQMIYLSDFIPSTETVKETYGISELITISDICYCKFQVKDHEDLFFYMFFRNSQEKEQNIMLATFFINRKTYYEGEKFEQGTHSDLLFETYDTEKIHNENGINYIETACNGEVITYLLNQEGVIDEILVENRYISLIRKQDFPKPV